MKKATLVVVLSTLAGLGVIGAQPPVAWAPAVGVHCTSVRAGGVTATHVFADYMPCRSVRSKLRRWLPRSHLPRKRTGWWCDPIGSNPRGGRIWSCTYPGSDQARRGFTFWSSQL
jgi:hypothetical protein